jgi:hypothetical protein
LGIIEFPHGLLDAVGGERGMEKFGACFEGPDDPRTGNAGRHDLLEILMTAGCCWPTAGSAVGGSGPRRAILMVDLNQVVDDAGRLLRLPQRSSLRRAGPLGLAHSSTPISR